MVEGFGLRDDADSLSPLKMWAQILFFLFPFQPFYHPRIKSRRNKTICFVLKKTSLWEVKTVILENKTICFVLRGIGNWI
jgi:hypothetical protein